VLQTSATSVLTMVCVFKSARLGKGRALVCHLEVLVVSAVLLVVTAVLVVTRALL
jgi:hypothetical protein